MRPYNLLSVRHKSSKNCSKGRALQLHLRDSNHFYFVVSAQRA
jgi:hypothetical protein